MPLPVIVAIVWLVVGGAVGVIEARRGGWRHGWVVSAVFGPFAIPLALQRRHQAPPEAAVLAPSRARRGRVDVLVGVDGSEASMAAATTALWLFGPRVRRVTLAAVLDVDTARPHADDTMYPEPWPEERAARAHLEAATAALHRQFGVEPGSVVLAGTPAETLERYAVDEGYEVLVVGCRGRGLSKLLLGSTASRLARKTDVPVLLIPAEPVLDAPDDARSNATTVG